MNLRIKQLAEQAGAVFEQTNGLNDCPQDSLVGDEIEKFAELIVRECAQFTDSDIRKFILNHFGVEESSAQAEQEAAAFIAAEKKKEASRYGYFPKLHP